MTVDHAELEDKDAKNVQCYLVKLVLSINHFVHPLMLAASVSQHDHSRSKH